MSEWWTYRLRSFLLFSARTYDRLIESYNADLWPWQPVLVAFALALLAWLARGRWPHRGRVVWAALALAWCSVAWAFEHSRFAAINWAADYVALAFAAQAALLAGLAWRTGVAPPGGASARRAIALAIATIGIAVYPLLTAAFGGGWPRAEVVGLMPAPTALATLGCLLLAAPRRVLPWLVPVAACVFEAALLWALHGR